MPFKFQDRIQAGRFLADKLEGLASDPRLTVLALPRGGVPVAFEVARRLGASLDVFLVRKLGAPGQEELAMGAIASGGVCFVNEEIVQALGVSQRDLEQAIARERMELRRRESAFRGHEMDAPLLNRFVILVDDGLATGATMRAAVIAVGQQNPARVIVAVPVAARDTYEQFKTLVDDIVCVETPDHFRGVGQWYEDFTQTSDEEVRALLEQAAGFRPASAVAC